MFALTKHYLGLRKELRKLYSEFFDVRRELNHIIEYIKRIETGECVSPPSRLDIVAVHKKIDYDISELKERCDRNLHYITQHEDRTKELFEERASVDGAVMIAGALIDKFIQDYGINPRNLRPNQIRDFQKD